MAWLQRKEGFASDVRMARRARLARAFLNRLDGPEPESRVAPSVTNCLQVDGAIGLVIGKMVDTGVSHVV